MNTETKKLWRFFVGVHSDKLTEKERRDKEKTGEGTMDECLEKIIKIEKENWKDGYGSYSEIRRLHD